MQGFVTDAFQFNNLAAGTQAGSPAPSRTSRRASSSPSSRAPTTATPASTTSPASIRRDGSSRLAEGHKWSTFPADLGLVAPQQRGLHARLPLLHPRAPRGLGTPGQPGGAAVRHAAAAQDRRRRQVSVRRQRGDDRALGARRSQNPDLKWETSEQTNVGIDWGIRNDRITGAIDIYQKTTKDLLLTVPVPQPAVVSHADPEHRLGARTAASKRRSTRGCSTRRTSR